MIIVLAVARRAIGHIHWARWTGVVGATGLILTDGQRSLIVMDVGLNDQVNATLVEYVFHLGGGAPH
jgi:hypothetical protein